jgi:hypothetical protein
VSRTQIRNSCLINLDDGKPKTWPMELKLQIIHNFIESRPELSQLIKKKDGIWSILIGFMEWILWTIGFID